ncbi:ABC transporter permease [Spiroplasma alleghenense]|uniref:ABC transporter permease n=1 Tax=Spiroplasma alleghenense TaxID=216931 RepID=A0A345Z3X6_9MOLU|nr:ABC transporter permease [Spiroplasma alleghenense]AXK51305.1 ABC transporter permease [Spiroplasma alleghenense]
MRKVLKSYLKSFVKAWVETFGTIIFVLTLTAVVVGMVATPLQLTNKNKGIENQINHWENYITAKPSYFNDSFLYTFFYNGEDYGPEGKEIIKNPLGDGTTLFSNDAKDYLKDFVNEGENQSHAEIGREIRNLLVSYEKGGAAEINNIKSDNIFTPDFQEMLSDQYHNDINLFVTSEVIKNNSSKIALTYELSAFLTSPRVGNNSFEIDLRQADAKNQMVGDKEINNLVISKGRNIEKDSTNEIVLTEKYAKTNKIKIGDKITLPGISTGQNSLMTVVGLGTKFDTLTPSSNYSILTSNPDEYAYGFVSYKYLDQLRSDSWESNKNNEIGYKTIIRTKNLIPNLNVFNLFAIDLLKSDSIYREGENFITPQYDYPTIQALSNIRIQVIIFLVLAVVVLVLAFIFINFVIKKEINNTRVQLGIFKAFGYKNSELSWIFATKMLITIAIGVIFGYIISIPLQDYVSGQFSNSVTYAFSSVYFSAWFATIIFIVIPLLFTAISYLLTLKYLSESALKLITNGTKAPTKSTFRTVLKWVFFPVGITSLILTKTAQSLSYHNKGFTWRLQQSFTARGKGKFIMVITIFSFSALLFTLQLGAKAVMGSAISQGYEMVQDGVDHRLTWKKNPEIDFKGDKVEIVNQDWDAMRTEFIGYKDNMNTALEQNSTTFRDNMSHVIGLLATDIAESKILDPMDILKVYKNVDITNDEVIKTKNTEEVLKLHLTGESQKTIMGATVNGTDGKKNNYYLSDVSKTICVLTQAYTGESADCNDSNNWGLPNSQTFSGLDLLTGISPDVQALMSMALTAQVDQNAVVTPNQIYIDSNRELLQYKTNVLVDDLNSQKFDLELDYFDDNLGRTQNIYRFSGVSDSQYNELKVKNSDPTKINAIVSYRIAKLMNLSVGSEFKVRTDTTQKQPLTIKVSGINQSNAFGTLIIASYENFFNAFRTEEGSNQVIEDYQNEIIYGNSIWSKNRLFNGSIDIDNIGASVAGLEFAGKSVAVSTGVDAPIFGTIFDKIFESLPGFGAGRAGNSNQFTVLTNGSLIAPTEFASNIPLELMTATLDTILARSTVLMTLFILLVAFLLTIILVVIMNIVVDEAANIILTMRALGYKAGEINWVVMGNYVIWTLIGFALAYLLSILVWMGILEFVWQSFGILIPFPSDWQTPIISFSILAAIMVIGWITAMLKISNRPLTNITAYS